MASPRTACKFAAAYQNLLESYGLTEQEALVIALAGFMLDNECRLLTAVNNLSERNGTVTQKVTLNAEEWDSEAFFSFSQQEDDE